MPPDLRILEISCCDVQLASKIINAAYKSLKFIALYALNSWAMGDIIFPTFLKLEGEFGGMSGRLDQRKQKRHSPSQSQVSKFLAYAFAITKLDPA